MDRSSEGSEDLETEVNQDSENLNDVTWLTLSTEALDWEFFIDVEIGLISKSLSKGKKYFMNSEPLSNMT